MTDTVKRQIQAIRHSGETNMLDANMAQWIANRNHYYELVIFIEDHRKEYMKYLFSGSAE